MAPKSVGGGNSGSLCPLVIPAGAISYYSHGYPINTCSNELIPAIRQCAQSSERCIIYAYQTVKFTQIEN